MKKEKELSNLLEIIPEGIGIIDREHQLVYSNEALNILFEVDFTNDINNKKANK